jgi:hypothetical protein
MARAVLPFRSRRFELHDAGVPTPSGRAVRIGDAADALRWLRRAAVDPVARAALRRFAACRIDAPRGAPIDDDEMLRGLARELASGRVTLFEQPPLPIAAIHGDEAASELPAAREPRRPVVERTWITIELVGEDDQPIPGARYRIELPDGSAQEGRLDSKGLARLRGIEPGKCVVTFPDLDREAWVPIGTTSQP